MLNCPFRLSVVLQPCRSIQVTVEFTGDTREAFVGIIEFTEFRLSQTQIVPDALIVRSQFGGALQILNRLVVVTVFVFQITKIIQMHRFVIRGMGSRLERILVIWNTKTVTTTRRLSI